MTLFEVKSYITTYIRRLNANFKTIDNYANISANFNTAIAVLTNSVIYNDLPLKVIDEFEKSIDWADEADDEEFTNPFITHLNPTSKLFITSFVDDDADKLESAAAGIIMMNDIAKKHGYKYQICMNKEIPKIMKLIKRLKMSTDDVIIMNEEFINTIQMINKSYAQNSFLNIEDKAPTESEQDVDKSAGSLVLREYQREYVDYMNEHNKAILKLPCGMGKSMIMIYHMLTHGRLSVILVPNIALVDQFYNNIVKTYKGFNKQPPEIHRLSTKYKETEIVDESKQQVIIAVYNSFVNIVINNLLRAGKKQTDGEHSKQPTDNENTIYKYRTFPYLYIDEAHHIILPKNGKQSENAKYILDKYAKEANTLETSDEDTFINSLHSLPNYTHAFSNMLFMFANKCCEHYAFLSATIEPANFSKYNMFAAIEEGYLCKLNVDILIDKNYGSKDIDKETKIENLATYLSKSEHQSIIIYTSRVDTAKEIQKRLTFRSAVITGSMSSTLRQEHFNGFLSKDIRALLTVNCISEGVDLPCADTAIFFDDKHSIINIIQCVGRVMRKDPTKISSTLVIPAYNDDDIDNIYTNVLTTVNGELGYGSVDIRRLTHLKFTSTVKNQTIDIRRNVYRKVYEYNSDFFNKISNNSKLKICSMFYNLNKCIPSLDMTFEETKMPDGKYFNLQQFVHDNINLNNEAGKGLRELYKDVINNPPKKPRANKQAEQKTEEITTEDIPTRETVKEPSKPVNTSPPTEEVNRPVDTPTPTEEVNRKVLTTDEVNECIGYRKDRKNYNRVRFSCLIENLQRHKIFTDKNKECEYLVKNNVIKTWGPNHKLYNIEKFREIYYNPLVISKSTDNVNRKVLTMDEITNKCIRERKLVSINNLVKLLCSHDIPTKKETETKILLDNNLAFRNTDGAIEIRNKDDYINFYLKKEVKQSATQQTKKLTEPVNIIKPMKKKTEPVNVSESTEKINRKCLTPDETKNCFYHKNLLRLSSVVNYLKSHGVISDMPTEKNFLIGIGVIVPNIYNHNVVPDKSKFNKIYIDSKYETVDKQPPTIRPTAQSTEPVIKQEHKHDYTDLITFKRYLSVGVSMNGLIQLINECYENNTPDENNKIYIRIYKQIRHLQQTCTNIEFKDVIIKSADSSRHKDVYKLNILKVDYSIPQLAEYKHVHEYITDNDITTIYDTKNNLLCYDIIIY